MGHPERRTRHHRAIHFADQRSSHGIRASGGVIFTTIQKFSPAAGEIAYPVLSNRRNIVVIADEAHRSHYGFQAGRSGHSGKTCSSLNGLSSGLVSILMRQLSAKRDQPE